MESNNFMNCTHRKLLCNKETCDGVEFEHEEHCGVCGVAFEKEKCTCASFFTVRGVHKKDCPCHESMAEKEIIVNHCEDCLAYYTGEHTCPPLLKALMRLKKLKK